MSRCADCTREAADGSNYCCDACHKFKVHTPECNKRTFPEWRAAEYADDSQAAEKIVERLQKSLSLAHVLHEELRTIGEAAKQFHPQHNRQLEQMLAHLRIDISYCESAARDLLRS